MSLGVRVGTLIFKEDGNWYKTPIKGLFDLDKLFSDEFLLPFIEKNQMVSLAAISKYGIYFLDRTRK